MKKIAAMFVLTAALTGCVAVWGRSYSIESQDADSIVIQYDEHFASLGDVEKIAQANCDAYDKKAAKQDETTTMWGITTVTFACAVRKG